MATNLVIVESPAKARTINRFLGDEYEVLASLGHVRDLPTKELGVDLEKGFEPHYIIIPKRRRTLSLLRKSAEKSDKVYLATDMDREGEAIAWHLKEALSLSDEKTLRVTFNEITCQAVQKAFSEPGTLSLSKVNAQQARRILDRIVGYKMSPLLWRWFGIRNLSAGRVQSVALRLIVEREREIRDFIPRKYWTVSVTVEASSGERFEMALARIVSSPTEKKEAEFESEKEAKEVVSSLVGKHLIVTEHERKKREVYPYPPFITSTLQQEMAAVYKMTPADTMRQAQSLYEGVELGEGKRKGLITYHRTDSVRVAFGAISAVRDFIKESFPKDYLPEKPHFYKVKSGAQAAHEAIRPTDVSLSPESVKQFLEKKQYSLYDAVWRRFVASQMACAAYEEDEAKASFECYEFEASRRLLSFDGYLKLYGKPLPCDDSLLPLLKVGDALHVVDFSVKGHQTEPPPRYTESSLIKKLESEEIGRPSTYATIVHTLYERKYVVKRGGQLFPTELGEAVTRQLLVAFPTVMDVGFTREVEAQLDLIEEEKKDWQELLRDFYSTFQQEMSRVKEEVTNSDRKCPNCGSELVMKFKRGDAFLACPRYEERDESGKPLCSYTEPLGGRKEKRVEETDIVCEKCGAKMLIREGRFGRFLSCSNFPKCKNARSLTALKGARKRRGKKGEG
ncbi:MAG: type I DNA topoisomerase [Planctomycetota bacterium]|nr:type I DNA topoisomerase [Planctomycetota bacterium]